MSRTPSLGIQAAPGPHGGLLAVNLDANGTAQTAGVQVGDEIVAINGVAITKADGVGTLLEQVGGVGAAVTLRLIRANAYVDLPVTLKRKTLTLDVVDVAEVLERKISP